MTETIGLSCFCPGPESKASAIARDQPFFFFLSSAKGVSFGLGGILRFVDFVYRMYERTETSRRPIQKPFVKRTLWRGISISSQRSSSPEQPIQYSPAGTQAYSSPSRELTVTFGRPSPGGRDVSSAEGLAKQKIAVARTFIDTAMSHEIRIVRTDFSASPDKKNSRADPPIAANQIQSPERERRAGHRQPKSQVAESHAAGA